MKTEILNQEKCSLEAKAVFDAAEVSKAIDGTYKKLSQKANIKGFRKGKVPRKTLELYFQKKNILAEAAEELTNTAIDNMIEEYELKLVADPSVDAPELKADSEYEIKFKFEVAPDIDLPNLEDIEVERTKFEATDKMVDLQVERILDDRADMQPTYEERPVTKEDYLSIKFDSYVIREDGSEEKMDDGQKTEIFMGEAGLRPEILAALEGKKPQEKVSVELPLDSEQAKADKAVKSRYEIEILGIMKKVKPELNDMFVVEFTQSKQKTVDEFKAEVKKQIQEMLDNQSLNSFKDAAVSKLTDMVECELPASLVARQKEALRQQQADRLQRENKMTMEEFFEKSGVTKEKYEEELDAAAKNIVKQSLVIEAVADANNIQWTNDELKKEIEMLAAASHVDVKKISDFIYNDQNRLFDIVDKIRSRKTVSFIAENVKAKEVQPKAAAEAKKENEAE